MPKKDFIPQKYKPWIEARKKLRLSHMHIQMARELGMTPKSLFKLANTGGQKWKAPLPEYLCDLYEKRFKKPEPENIRSIEQMVKAKRNQKEQKRQAKAQAEPQQAPASG